MNPDKWAARHMRERWKYVDTDPPTRDFENLRGDCWTFVMHVQRQSFNREVPDVYGYGSSSDKGAVFDAAAPYKTEDYGRVVTLSDSISGDIILLAPENGILSHVGVVCGEACFIHLSQRGVSISPLRYGMFKGKFHEVRRPN